MAFSNAERDRLYDLLPAFIRERDQQSGERPARAPRRRRSPGRCHRRGYQAASGRRLHRDLRALGRRIYRRSRRHLAALRRDPVSRTATRRSSCFPISSAPRTAESRRCMAVPSAACRAGAAALRGAALARRRGEDHLLSAAARARCPCSRSWRAMSPVGRRMRSSISNSSAGRSGCAITCAPTRCARPTSARSNAWTGSTAPSTRSRTPSMCGRSPRTRAGTISATSASISGGSIAYRARTTASAASRRGRRLPLLLQSARQLRAAIQPRSARGRRGGAGDRAARAAADPAGAVLH